MKKNQKKQLDKAYLKAIEEIEKDKVLEVKAIVKEILEGIISTQKERRAADKKLSLLKSDLDDIRHGRVEKIKERHARARADKRSVPFDEKKLENIFGNTPTIFYDRFGPPSEPLGNLTYTKALGHSATDGNFTLADGSTVTISTTS